MIKITDPGISADRCYLRAIEDEKLADKCELEGKTSLAKSFRRSAAARRGAAKRIMNQYNGW